MRKTKEQRKTTVGAFAPSGRPSTKARHNKGITLIALVITVIVMLILVSVTIATAVNGGLFEYAKKAVDETKNAINAEQQLGSGKVQIDGVWYDSIDDYLAGKPSSGTGDGEGGTEGGLQIELSIAGEKGTTVPVPTGFEHVEGTIDEGYVIEDENGNQFVWVPVEANQKMSLKITSDKDIKSVKLKDPFGDIILTIEDGNIQNTYNNTQIEPTVNGMYTVAVETEDETVQETLVVRSLYALDTWNDWYISEDFADTMTGGTYTKEQVWEVMVQQMGYESLEVAMQTNGCSTIDEFITFYWASFYKHVSDLVNYKDSVNNNKGFYIGRYELGVTTDKTDWDYMDTVETIISKNGIPVTKADVYPYKNITFDQALGLAESMYSSTEFTESLLTNSAWDRTLGWLYETSENKEEILKQLAGDSTEWGNYSNADFNITKGSYYEDTGWTEVTGIYTKAADEDNPILLTTGATTEVIKRNCKNNIFDLAGNVEEWTNTATDENNRMIRGGRYTHTGINDPAACFWTDLYNNRDKWIGARVALYLQ